MPDQPPNTLYYGDNLDILGPSDMLAYLSMMARRVLKPTGSRQTNDAIAFTVPAYPLHRAI